MDCKFTRGSARRNVAITVALSVHSRCSKRGQLHDGRTVVEDRDNGTAPAVTYSRGRDLSGSLEGVSGLGCPLARSHAYNFANWTYHNWYHADWKGNMTALVNSGGTLQASYIYDPYGGYLSGTGTLLTSNVMRFSSKPWVSFLSSSATSGLYYYGYRFYDLYLQRWIQSDLLEELGGRNLYLSLANNPGNTIDAAGLSWYHWIAVFNVISCFKDAPGESVSDYLSVPPVTCEECARDKDLAERRCKNAVDQLGLKYSGNLEGPAIATGIQDLFLLGLGFYAPPAWGLFVVSGIGTACEVKAIHNIERSAQAYKEMYCECPDFDESEVMKLMEQLTRK